MATTKRHRAATQKTLTALIALCVPVCAFVTVRSDIRLICRSYFVASQITDQSDGSDEGLSIPVVDLSRRDWISTTAILTGGFSWIRSAVAADSVEFKPAIRPKAYRVDSTIPPTLLPLKARQERQIIKALALGSGTDKEAIVIDTVNLNNMLNKAVFGTARAVGRLVEDNKENRGSNNNLSSFVCLGVPLDTKASDVELATSLTMELVQARQRTTQSTALGLTMFPSSTQLVLDAFVTGGAEDDLKKAVSSAGVAVETVQMYLPLLQRARDSKIDVLALGVESTDLSAVQSKGLSALDTDRRSQYVADAQGFIALTSVPSYKLYTDRSLFRDNNDSANAGNFFAQRILAHEAAATLTARYAVQREDALVIVVAHTPDVRYLRGMNGRIPRVYNFLSQQDSLTDDAVTTILLNPSAKETLSASRFLRLEIGTGPDTLAYQTKVADYLWFQDMPPVNLLPRLMDG